MTTQPYPEWFKRVVAERKSEGLQAGNLVALEPQIFNIHMDYIGKTVKYDTATKKLVFLTGVSAFTPNPVNLFLRGESSTGKTYNTVEALKGFPQDDVLYLGGLSPKALIHDYGILVDANGNEIDFSEKPSSSKPRKRKNQSKEEYEHELELWKQARQEWQERIRNSRYIIDLHQKILVFLESPPKETFSLLRPILSHDKEEISFKFTDKTSSGKLQTSHVVIKGHPATIFLSTVEEYLEELATRSFTATPETTATKIRAGVNLVGERKAFPWKFNDDTPEFMLLEGHLGWLRNTLPDLKVVNPMGVAFAEAYPSNTPRCMRDVDHVMSLMDVHALFHAYQRPTLQAGDTNYVLVTARDIEFLREFLPSVMETTQTGLAEYMLQIFHQVIEPLYNEQGAFDYKTLTDKHNEVMGKKRSRATLYPIISALTKVNWVSTDPNPTDKRSHVITVIKNNEENTFDSLLKTFVESYSLESFESWLEATKKYLCGNGVLLKANILDNGEATPEEVFKNFYTCKLPETQRYSSEPAQPDLKAKEQKTLAETFTRESKTISTILQNLKSGPHQLAINECRQDVCYGCFGNKEITATFEDFKGDKHDLCGECMWAVSKALKRREN